MTPGVRFGPVIVTVRNAAKVKAVRAYATR